MDNEDTRVPTVHIESGGPIIDDTQLEHWGDPMANIDPAAHPRPTNSHTTQVPRLSDSASSGIPLWTMRTGCPYCP